MIASGPAVPDTSTCAQALAIAEKYHLALSAQAKALLAQETPKGWTVLPRRSPAACGSCAAQQPTPAGSWAMSR